MEDLQRLLAAAVAELDREDVATQRESAQREERAARAFLARLDADSQEGMWFDAVATAFPSRLHAAVAYLREVKR